MADMQRSPQESTPERRRPPWLDPRFGWSQLERFFGDMPEPMRVEEYTEGTQAVVRVELPGIDPDKDVDISVSDNTLHIRAERREESKTEEKGGYRSEFRYGSFVRTIDLPAGCSEQDVNATYKDGILEVRVPIDEASAKARKIQIQRG
jgi:HSP20 family protein